MAWRARHYAGLGASALAAAAAGWALLGPHRRPTSVLCEAVAVEPSPVIVPSAAAAGASTGPSMAAPKPHEIMKYGYPGFENVKRREGHVLSYDRRHRTANWVVERLTRESLKERNADRGDHQFYEDDSEPPLFRATLNDYRRSGYDRGHLAAAGNHRYDAKALNDTFSLSNMSPQVGKGFNRGIWNSLEMYVRGLAAKFDTVYVITGPLYLPNVFENGRKYVKYEVIGPNDVAVPTHFFKALLLEKDNGKTIQIEAYVIPNTAFPDNTPISQFKVPLEQVEKASGFFFFDQLGPGRYAYVTK